MEVIENPGEFSSRFARWNVREDLSGYPWIDNRHAPFTPLKRALPLLNIAIISSAGAYINGTEAFDLDAKGGDMTYREIPVEVGAGDVPAAALDSAENKYLFVRYIEKSENLKILTSTLSRASEPRR